MIKDAAITEGRDVCVVDIMERLPLRWRLVEIGVIILCGCSDNPPMLRTKTDIARLDAKTQNVWARSLPDSEIPGLARLQNLQHVDFMAGCAVIDAPITDDGLEKLSKLNLPKLEGIVLGYCDQITDAGLVHLAKMDTVTYLIFDGCPRITDDGLSHFTQMKSLTKLRLNGCPRVTDAGLEYLSEKHDWKSISLNGCPSVTVTGIESLQKHLPNTRIEKDDAKWELNRCHRK